MPRNSRSTATDSDKNVKIPVRDCVQQSNVRIALLNFSLYYERFNFYDPLLFSLHPTSLSKWKSQLIILTCPAMIQRSPRGRLQVAQWMPFDDFPCLGCRQITPGSPSGVPTENGWSPFGHLFFFSNNTPNSHGSLAAELIWVTSADHLTKFNWELKCSGRRPMSKGWALQEAIESCWQETPFQTLGQLASPVEAGRSRVLVQLHENEAWDVRQCYPVLCRFEPYCSRIAPVFFPCLPYCSRFFPIFPCFSRMGQYDGGGVCFLPISPFLPASFHVIPDHLPSLPVFSRIANMGRNGPIRGMCNGGITSIILLCCFPPHPHCTFITT